MPKLSLKHYRQHSALVTCSRAMDIQPYRNCQNWQEFMWNLLPHAAAQHQAPKDHQRLEAPQPLTRKRHPKDSY